jgi:hypothetical protein
MKTHEITTIRGHFHSIAYPDGATVCVDNLDATGTAYNVSVCEKMHHPKTLKQESRALTAAVSAN